MDLAKRVFQVHGASLAGHMKFRKKLTREQFRRFMSDQPACFVVFEACGGANYWAGVMKALGHDVKLIAPQYVRPFVKRQKNDAADAEAIVTAARQPEMRFVEPKTAEQQAKAVLFRGRERLVNQRTELVNALRAMLYEYGHVVPVGIGHLKRMATLLDGSDCDLPALVITEGRDLVEQTAEKTKRIDEKTRKLKALAGETDTARRLQTMPGIGPLTALALETFAPDMAHFKCGRGFAAWLGLVPRQHSSGGKAHLGQISKAGQGDIRRLLIIGAPIVNALSRLNWLGRRSIPESSWLAKMLARKPKTLVAIALANKMARQIWAMLTKTEDYRDPALAAAT